MLATTCPSSMRSRRRMPPSRRSSRWQNTRPAKRVARSKTASRVFLRQAPKARPVNVTQTAGTHQGTWVWAYDFASGCAVDPNRVGSGIPNSVPGHDYLTATSKPGDFFYPGRNPGESFLGYLGRSFILTTSDPYVQSGIAISGPGSNFGGALNQKLNVKAINIEAEGPPTAITRVSNRPGNQQSLELNYPDGRRVDINADRVKQWVPATDPRAPAGTMQKVTFENAQTGSKGFKRYPTPEELEMFENRPQTR